MNTQTIAQRLQAKKSLLFTTLSIARDRGLVRYDDSYQLFDFEIAGLDAIGCVRGSYDEVSVKAIVQPTALGRQRARSVLLNAKFRARIGAAWTCGWLDRATGRFIEVTGDFHAANHITPRLARMTFTKDRRAEHLPATELPHVHQEAPS
ncbi:MULTISPECIES: hypothetical protein [unclassified Bradyrhizobium]|uniref:hypothetical protein n=1 Tax=unclassified Bradyrhizobium TaxID=2631580 RepID=UPI00339A5898